MEKLNFKLHIELAEELKKGKEMQIFKNNI